MKKEIWMGKKNLRFFYYRYKDSAYYPISLTIFTIVVCIVLLFYVVIPQIKDWFSIRQEVIATQQRIRTLQENIDFMRSVDKAVLDSQLRTASMAVPSEKDFGGILNALTDASVRSGISLQDFSFQVGSIPASSDIQISTHKQNLSTVTLSVIIRGELDNVKRFLRELGEKVPISEVTAVDGNIQSLSLHIKFYQKELPQVELNDTEPIVRISAQKQALLEKLASWQPATQILQDTPTSTESASGEVPLF